jgi:hypothetical protein
MKLELKEHVSIELTKLDRIFASGHLMRRGLLRYYFTFKYHEKIDMISLCRFRVDLLFLNCILDYLVA